MAQREGYCGTQPVAFPFQKGSLALGLLGNQRGPCTVPSWTLSGTMRLGSGFLLLGPALPPL